MKEKTSKDSDDSSVIEGAHCRNQESCTGNVRCEFVSNSRQRGRLHSIVTSLTSTRSQPSEKSRVKQEEGSNLHLERDYTVASSKCNTSRKISPTKVTSNATKEFFNFVMNKRKTKTGQHQQEKVNEVVEQTTEMSSANTAVSRNATASGHLKSTVSQTQEPILLNLDSQVNTAQLPLTTSGLPSVISLPGGNQQALLFLVGAPGLPVTGDLAEVGSLGSSVPFGNAVFLAQPLALNLAPADASLTSGVIEKAMELANVGTNSVGTASQQPQCASESMASQSEFASQTLQDAMQSLSSQSSLMGGSSFNPVPQVSQDIVLAQSTSGESIAIDNISQSVTVQTTQVAQTQSRVLPSLLEVVKAEVSGSGSEVSSRPKMIYKRKGASYREVMTQTGNEPEVIILNEVREHFTEHSTGNTPNGDRQSSTAKKPGPEKVRRFPCDICDKKFFSNHDLRRHRAIHQDSRPFVCEVCKKAFRTHSELKLHLAIHNEGTPFKCEFCGKEFRTKGCIKSHVKYHIGDKRHKCTECGRAFVKSADLKRHMAGHRNEKKFVCDDCGSAFTRRDNLKAHRLLHSRESVVTCDLCNKEFINAVYLKRHMHIHKQAKKKPYECQWCPKTYEQLEGLRRHIRQHVGDEKFVCKHCAKKFITSIQLKRHLWLSHEQDSPYRRSIL